MNSRRIVWRKSGCDLRPEGPQSPDGLPVCAQFVIDLEDKSGLWGHIVVGTERHGIGGKPEFLGLHLSIRGGEKFASSDKLSDLPRLIEKAKDSRRAPVTHGSRAPVLPDGAPPK